MSFLIRHLGYDDSKIPNVIGWDLPANAPPEARQQLQGMETTHDRAVKEGRWFFALLSALFHQVWIKTPLVALLKTDWQFLLGINELKVQYLADADFLKDFVINHAEFTRFRNENVWSAKQQYIFMNIGQSLEAATSSAGRLNVEQMMIYLQDSIPTSREELSHLVTEHRNRGNMTEFISAAVESRFSEKAENVFKRLRVSLKHQGDKYDPDLQMYDCRDEKLYSKFRNVKLYLATMWLSQAYNLYAFDIPKETNPQRQWDMKNNANGLIIEAQYCVTSATTLKYESRSQQGLLKKHEEHSKGLFQALLFETPPILALLEALRFAMNRKAPGSGLVYALRSDSMSDIVRLKKGAPLCSDLGYSEFVEKLPSDIRAFPDAKTDGTDVAIRVAEKKEDDSTKDGKFTKLLKRRKKRRTNFYSKKLLLVEIGAHNGDCVFKAVRKLPNMHAIAIEPGQKAFENLQLAVETDSDLKERVQVVRKVITDNDDLENSGRKTRFVTNIRSSAEGYSDSNFARTNKKSKTENNDILEVSEADDDDQNSSNSANSTTTQNSTEIITSTSTKVVSKKKNPILEKCEAIDLILARGSPTLQEHFLDVMCEAPIDKTTLDYEFDTYDHTKSIDILKIHCQGCEYSAIRGAENLMAENRICMIQMLAYNMMEAFGFGASQVKTGLDHWHGIASGKSDEEIEKQTTARNAMLNPEKGKEQLFYKEKLLEYFIYLQDLGYEVFYTLHPDYISGNVAFDKKWTPRTPRLIKNEFVKYVPRYNSESKNITNTDSTSTDSFDSAVSDIADYFVRANSADKSEKPTGVDKDGDTYFSSTGVSIGITAIHAESSGIEAGVDLNTGKAYFREKESLINSGTAPEGYSNCEALSLQYLRQARRYGHFRRTV